MCGPSLLLVEDEAVIAMAERRQLEALEYSVHHVGTGEEALALVEGDELEIDLVLMDIDLGSGIDGATAAQRILASHNLPIVFLSSRTEQDFIERVEKTISYGFVPKAAGIVALDTSIKMALRLFAAREEQSRVACELLESERKYRYLFDNLGEEAHLWEIIRDARGSVENWRLLDANKLALTAWGVSKQDVVGKLSTEIWPEADPVGQFRHIVENLVPDGAAHAWEEEFSGTNQRLQMRSVGFGGFYFSIGHGDARTRDE
jgi:CheY-like chemotaxis protein